MTQDVAETRTTTEEISQIARAAGEAGRSWAQFQCDDSVQDFVADQDELDEVVLGAWRQAFDAGHAVYLAAQGWVSRWTTAPEDYDSFGTTTTETCGAWRGQVLRQVLCHPHHVGYQEARNGSGMHPTWDQDPRVEEREAALRADRLRVEDQTRDAQRAQGLAWLAQATEAEISDAQDRDEIESRGLSYAELRAEIGRREAARTAVDRSAAWAHCTAIVRPGMILVDDGELSQPGKYGPVGGRDPAVYYAIQVRDDWAQDADEARVVDLRGTYAGTLSSVARWVESGRLRVVGVDDVPPEPVTRRLGVSSWRPIGEIRRVVVSGRPVWVGTRPAEWRPIALDERGHLVRGRRGDQAIELARQTDRSSTPRADG